MLASPPVAGIDVGKSFLDLGFEPAARAFRVGNDPAGIASLIGILRRRGQPVSRWRRSDPTPGP